MSETDLWLVYLRARAWRSAALRRRQRLQAALRPVLALPAALRRLWGLRRHPVASGVGIAAVYVILLAVAYNAAA